jgi:ribose-phosphate pyrophosphokinase
MSEKQDLVSIFGCRATAELAGKIAGSYGCEFGQSSVFPFADGEFQPAFEENIRGRHVFIVQSTFPPADNLLELMMMVDAARRASAKNIVAVIPYFGLARQDRKDRPRVSIASKLVANLLTAAGVQRV